MNDIIKEALLFRHSKISNELQARCNPANFYDTSFGNVSSELIEIRHALLWRKKYPEDDIIKSPYSKLIWTILEDYEKEKNKEWIELDNMKPKSLADEEDIKYKKNQIEIWLTLVKNLKIRH